MNFKEDLTVKKVEDTVIEKNGETELTHKRTLTLENAFTTITIKGDPKYIPRFNTGEIIQIWLQNPQTQLIPEDNSERIRLIGEGLKDAKGEIETEGKL